MGDHGPWSKGNLTLHYYSSTMGLRTAVAGKINTSLLFIHHWTADQGDREN